LDTLTLRWVIIVIGVLILGSIFLFGNPDRKRKPRASRKKEKSKSERQEPTLEVSNEPEFIDTEISLESGQGELPIGDSDIQAVAEPAMPRKPAGPPPDKIKSLFLLARDNHIINGAELLQVALSTGMEFGDMSIFHRLPEGSEQAIFSMANAAKPGYFSRDAWNTFETSGVVLFMTLPGPSQALDAWDSMHATARRMAEILHADLLDEEHNLFTRQTEAQIREEMREYDRSKA